MSIIREFSDFSGETEHFSGKNGALRWSILVGKQKHNVQKPIHDACLTGSRQGVCKTRTAGVPVDAGCG